MRFLISILILLGLSINPTFSQEISKVYGRIVDDNLRPVQDANIIITGTRLGTISNKDGGFELNHPYRWQIHY